MEGPQHQQSSYFSFSSNRRQSTGSSPVSPTKIDSPSASPSHRVQRPPAHRTVSDHTTLHSRVKVQTIEEDTTPRISTTTSVKASRLSQTTRWSSDFRRSLSSITRSSPSPSNSTPVTVKPRQGRLSSTATEQASWTRPPCKPRPGHRWDRTKSGSVWYERLRGSSAHSKDSSDHSQRSPLSKRLITPLTPPARPAMARGPSYRHHVRVEQSFTDFRPRSSCKSNAQQSQSSGPTNSTRNSINPRQLFPAPFQLVRRISMPKRRLKPDNQQAMIPESGPTDISCPRATEMRGHKSLLKRIRTSEALRQVTSILHETSRRPGACLPVTVVKMQNVHQMSDKSSSSKGSKKHVYPRSKSTKELLSPALGPSRRSSQDFLGDLRSYSLSQWEFRMGAQPTNTPDERATYKIKRSPSVETEEFLKVDISVRGGTSYLPSEARRIHTPPLRQEGPDGKRRGFFFDYTAPRSDAGQPVCLSSLPRLALPKDIDTIANRSTTKTDRVHHRTFTDINGNKITRAKTGDWYDAKLAELDNTDDGKDLAKRPQLGRGRSATTDSGMTLSEIKPHREKQMFDLSIPEHLPTSPLCPRNERYWRVFKGKGNQFRGCWMHGVGVYGGI